MHYYCEMVVEKREGEREGGKVLYHNSTSSLRESPLTLFSATESSSLNLELTDLAPPLPHLSQRSTLLCLDFITRTLPSEPPPQS